MIQHSPTPRPSPPQSSLCVIACVKQVCDPLARLVIGSEGRAIDRERVAHILNPHDEHAVEEALRLRERLGRGQVVAITLGPERTEDALRYCLAMGADEGVRIPAEIPGEPDSHRTAQTLAKAISTLNYTLVLCGRQSIEWGSGTVGAVLAEFLGLPLVSGVTRLEVDPDLNSAVVERSVDHGGRQIIRCPLPALFTVDATINHLRYISVRAQRKARDRTLTQLNVAQAEVAAGRAIPVSPGLRLVRLTPPKPKKIFRPASTLSAAERMRLVMMGGPATHRKGSLLTGSPQAIASQVVEYLVSQRIVKPERGA